MKFAGSADPSPRCAGVEISSAPRPRSSDVDAGGSTCVLDGEAQPRAAWACAARPRTRSTTARRSLLITGRADDALARHLVPGRRRDQPPDRPGRAGSRAGRARRASVVAAGHRARTGWSRPVPLRSIRPGPPAASRGGRLDPGHLAGSGRAHRAASTLTADETAWAMNEIMEGAATPAQIAGFGVALRAKGETVAEMTGLAAVDARARHPDHRPRSRRSTWSAPAATRRTRSTSPRWPRSWPPPRAPGWSSTATGPPRPRAARPTCSRTSACVIDLPAGGDRRAGRARSASAFLFAPLYHPALRLRGPDRAASSACPPCSTSSAR